MGLLVETEAVYGERRKHQARSDLQRKSSEDRVQTPACVIHDHLRLLFHSGHSQSPKSACALTQVVGTVSSAWNTLSPLSLANSYCSPDVSLNNP